MRPGEDVARPDAELRIKAVAQVFEELEGGGLPAGGAERNHEASVSGFVEGVAGTQATEPRQGAGGGTGRGGRLGVTEYGVVPQAGGLDGGRMAAE